MIGNIIRKTENVNYLRFVAFIAVIVALIIAIFMFNNRNEINSWIPGDINKKGLSKVIAQLPIESGEILVSSTATKKMYIDTKTLNIKIEDIKTGVQWNSIYDDDKATDYEKSPLIINFLGKDSKMYEWTAFKSCIANKSYVINKIANGVQIVFDFIEPESYDLDQYMPQKISIDRYEKVFINKLDEKVAEGTLSQEKAEKYKDALELVYKKDEKNNCYFNKLSGEPPASITSLLIELSKEVGYTREMLLQDSEEFGITVNIVEPAHFKIFMEITLDNDDLVVRIPTYEIKNENSSYILQNIEVCPNFGLASANEVDEGYILVPDGAGALFKLNTFNDKYPEYIRPVYNNNYYSELYEMPKFPEDLTMPIFGMMYKKGISTDMQGFMGIIEEGAPTAYINVKLGTKDTSGNGTPYNKVFTSFDVAQYSRVKVFGPYSSNDARYLSTTGPIDMDFTVRYKFFPQNASYFNMAMEYKNYLIKNNGIKVHYDNKPKLFLDVISSLSIKERFMGIPYDKIISMTTYNELVDILKSMEGINKVIIYDGAFNGGMNNEMFNRVDLVPENGSIDDLTNLKDYISHDNDELYFGIDMMKVYKGGNGFNKNKYALYGFDSKPLEIKSYNLATGRFMQYGNAYYIINPKYLSGIVNNFISATSDYKNIYLRDMGNTYYANYNSHEIIDPIKASMIVDNSLANLQKMKVIAIDNPNADKISYSKYATDISRESSNFGTIYCSVPFRQLVMNGLTEYTTLDVNMSKDDIKYYILQAVELGSYPKFTICSKNIDILKYTNFSDYFSMQYSMLQDTILNVYQEYEKAYEEIGSKEIVGHNMLQKNVFETDYASRVKVIVNYNKYPVIVNGKEIEALGYYIYK